VYIWPTLEFIFTAIVCFFISERLAIFIKKKRNIQLNSLALRSVGLFILIFSWLLLFLIKDSYFSQELKIFLLIVRIAMIIFGFTFFNLAFLNRDKEKKSWEVFIDIAIFYVFMLCVFVLGLIRCVVIKDGLEIWLNFHWIIAAPLAFILACIPIIGDVIAVYGAVEVRGWSWLAALVVFFGYLIPRYSPSLQFWYILLFPLILNSLFI
jgi:hypothetical protein